MTWLEALRKVLKREVLVRRPEGADIVLSERGPDMSMERSIAGTPAHAAVLSMKHVDHLSCVVEGRWRQRCDYLIFAERNGRSDVVLIELKRTLAGTKPFAQLFHTAPIVAYLVAVGGVFGVPTGSVGWRRVVLVDRMAPHIEKPPVRVAAGEPARIDEHRDMRIPIFLQGRLRFADLLAAAEPAAK